MSPDTSRHTPFSGYLFLFPILTPPSTQTPFPIPHFQDVHRLSQWQIEDVLYHNGKFYVLGSLRETVSINCESFDFELVVAPLLQIKSCSAKYLVKSFDDLYMLGKCYLDVEYQESPDDEYHSIRWNVFKLDEGKCQWVLVKNGLKDRVFFVGDDCTFSVSAKDFSGCKGGCVYFNQNAFSKARTDYPGSGAAIFDLENDIAGPLSAFPGYSRIFWPPPTWLLQLEFLLNVLKSLFASK